MIENKFENARHAIRRAEDLLININEKQAQWNEFYKENNFNNAFWRLDGVLSELMRQMKNLPYATYPITDVEDLEEYILFHKQQLAEGLKNG